jgi:hypothetical protein
MDLDVDNVLIYVDDAVRYDVISEALSQIGPTYETIAASTHTPTSFGSLLTGLLPPNSGIHSFKHTVPRDVRSVFDVDSHATTIAAEGGMNDGIADIFDDPPRATIEEVEPPFLNVVRRPGGHAPYDGFEWDDYEYEDETAVEYFDRIATDHAQAKADYVNGVETSFEEFQRVLDVLEARGLREDTLVVYTSDHGEFLGEYGFLGHTHVAAPEVVYVPTTFVHPSLDPGHRDELFHHVDLLPTIESTLSQSVDFGNTDGVVEGKGRETGYNHLEHIRYGTLSDPLEKLVQLAGGFERVLQSLWGRNGGHVFVEGSRVTASMIYFVLLTQKPFGRQVRHRGDVLDAYERFVPGYQSYGTPRFTKAAARAEIESILAGVGTTDERQIDDETATQLEEMGYL